MTTIIVADAPLPAVLEWLPLMRNAAALNDDLVIAVDEVLFPVVRWGVSKCELRPLSADLRSGEPSAQSLQMVLRGLKALDVDVVCLLDGYGGHLHEHLRAHFESSRHLRVLLADHNGRFPDRAMTSGTLRARGIVDLDVVGISAGIFTNQAFGLQAPSAEALARLPQVMQRLGMHLGPYIVADLPDPQWGDGGDFLSRVRIAAAGHKHNVINVSLVGDTTRSPGGTAVPRLDIADLALLMFGSSGVVSNAPATAYIASLVGRACLAIWGGRRWRDHLPLHGGGVDLGCALPIAANIRPPTDLAPASLTVPSVEGMFGELMQERHAIEFPAEQKACYEYIETLIYPSAPLSHDTTARTVRVIEARARIAADDAKGGR